MIRLVQRVVSFGATVFLHLLAFLGRILNLAGRGIVHPRVSTSLQSSSNHL